MKYPALIVVYPVARGNGGYAMAMVLPKPANDNVVPDNTKKER